MEKLVKKLREYAGVIIFLGIIAIMFTAYAKGMNEYNQQHRGVQVNEVQK